MPQCAHTKASPVVPLPEEKLVLVAYTEILKHAGFELPLYLRVEPSSARCRSSSRLQSS